MHVGMRDRHPFGLAGLHERWLSPEGEVLDTCTIITAEACPSLRSIHDRMPVIVPPVEYARWLDPSNTDVADLVTSWSGDPLRAYPVSTRVNAVRNDDAALCEPIEIHERHDALPEADASPPKRVGDHARDEPADEEPVQTTLF